MQTLAADIVHVAPAFLFVRLSDQSGMVRDSPNRGSTLLSKRVMAPIRLPRRVRTRSPFAWAIPVRRSRRYTPKAGWLLARVATSRYRRPSRKATAAKNWAASSRPWYSSGLGGMLSHTSWVSNPMMPSTSPLSKAVASRENEFLLGGGVRWRYGCVRGSLAALKGRAGSFECAAHRRRGGVENVGCLVGAEPEDVTENEDCALSRRQELQGGDEGQRDGRSCLVARFGAEPAVGNSVEEDVGVGLEPHQLARSRRFDRAAESGLVPGRRGAPAGRPQRVHAATGRNPA
jgi:hypothetical protein